MFDELLESVTVRKTTRKGWTVVASAVFEFACLAFLILFPLVRGEALPIAMLQTMLVAPVPQPPSPPPPRARPPQTFRPVRLLKDNVLHEPIVIPKSVAMYADQDSPPNLLSGAGEGGGVGGGLNLLKNMQGSSVGAPGPASPPVPIQRIKLGGQLQAAKVIFARPPVYPPLALQARIQGTVVLHAIIETDGRVGSLQVISGHPILARAAMDAVRAWRYLPTQLNGEPVEVDTTITVKFVLRR